LKDVREKKIKGHWSRSLRLKALSSFWGCQPNCDLALARLPSDKVRHEVGGQLHTPGTFTQPSNPSPTNQFSRITVVDYEEADGAEKN
jgi:hypothetical protein